MSLVSSRTIMMSRPLTISGFRLEASANSGKTVAGRRLAKKSHSLRRPRIAASGRSGRSSLSYCGPPTAPKRVASDCLTRSSVFGGSGCFCASYAAPPTSASSVSIVSPSLRKISSTAFASRRISGPMPSPARRAIFIGLLRENPRFRFLPLLLVSLDLVRMLQREPDLIEPVQQVFLARRIDVEAIRLSARRRHGLLREIDRELVAGMRAHLVEQVIHLELG